MAQQSQAFLKNQPVDSSCQQIYLRRKPALDQLDSRIDRAAANVTSYQTMFLFTAAPLYLIPARSDTGFTPESITKRRVFCVCFSVHSVQRVAVLNVGHTDSHGSVSSTTALIATPRARFQPVTVAETHVKRPKHSGIGSICQLGYICSGLASAVRDPYHSVAGVVFALRRISRNWTDAVGDGYFSERDNVTRSSASLGFCPRAFSRRMTD